ncbi:hypothetical protein L2U69_14955 [Zavarzinia compransoris]|uniref:hypothetical protein n=1 Tax=Zavarzinia marina TaxID=2911065 RepID=UPI001F3878AC|nr:hypothetical protein [Zavarzinia marina]MCF4166950.1 hypothetical protein [Zavarzinia marina]
MPVGMCDSSRAASVRGRGAVACRAILAALSVASLPALSPAASAQSVGSTCYEGYIVGVVGPYPPGRGGAWDEFGVYVSKNSYWDGSQVFMFSDSTNISLQTELGRVLYAQAVNAMNMGYQVVLSSINNSCGSLGFSTIRQMK